MAAKQWNDLFCGLFASFTNRFPLTLIISHFLRIRTNSQPLLQKVAEIHAAAILSSIEKLSCPKEQKLKLLETVKKAAT